MYDAYKEIRDLAKIMKVTNSVELNEIVIGAIDCLDPIHKTDYRIEINDMREKHFIVSIAVLIDTYMRKDILK